MDVSALEARLTRMEQEIAELRRENQSLRAITPAPEPDRDAKQGEVLPRRAVLTGAAYALGAVGFSLMGTQRAGAAIGNMIYGTINNAGTDSTSLASHAFQTLGVYAHSNSGVALNAQAFAETAVLATGSFAGNTGPGHGVLAAARGTGHSVYAVKESDSATGHGVLALHQSTSSFYAAIAGVTKGGGPGCYGRGEGSGNGLWGQIADAAKGQSAVLGTTEGSGAAIEGTSIGGRGGVFKGKKAQVRLVASTATTKPATGTRGDLFVDSTGRLWFCKASGSTTGWKQLA